MQKKIKLSILAIMAIIIIGGGVYLMQSSKPTPTSQLLDSALTEPINQTTPEQNQESGPKVSEPINADTEPEPEAISEISGKVRSINEKAVYIQLADGKGFAANINPKTPVIIQGAANPGTLVNLKPGQNVTVKVDSASNAIEILINK